MKTTKNSLIVSLLALSVFGGATALAGTITTPILTSLVLSPSTVKAGTSSVGTVKLQAPVSTTQTVTLSSSASVAQVPSSVKITAGSTSATFLVKTVTSNDRVPTTKVATIKATLGTTIVSANLTVTP